MAVQQDKNHVHVVACAAHDALTAQTLSVDATTGEKHLRHHMTPDGFFRGRKITASKDEE